MFEKLCDNIYRLCVPFESLYTSVFLVRTNDGDLLIDSADSSQDVDTYIIPALNEMGVSPDSIALTHLHGDHAGGTLRLAEVFCDAKIYALGSRITEVFPTRGKCVCDGDTLLGCIRILSLAGHSSDSIGFLDTRSNILIGGDAVQLYGIGKYGCGLGSPSKYIKTLERLLSLSLDGYIASHDYHPLGAYAFDGEVEKYLREAICDIECITAFVKSNLGLGSEKDIANAFFSEHAKGDSAFPMIPPSTVKAIIDGK